MKRILSISLIMLLVLNVVAFAGAEGELVNPDITVIANESSGNNFKLEIGFSVDKVEKGDYFDLQFPMPIVLPENSPAKIVKVGGNNYRVIFEESMENVTGAIGGSKTFLYNEVLDAVTINGEVVVNEFNTPDVGHAGEVDEDVVRDRFYKMGFLNGTNIDWQLVVGGDKTGVNGSIVIDEIGDGHILDENTMEFIHYIGESGTLISVEDTHIIDNLSTSPEGFRVDVSLANGEYLLIKYTTNVTNFEQYSFKNQAQLQGEPKITEEVIVDSWGHVDGDKPTEPEEPTTPEEPEEPTKPEEPEEPTKPTDPVLPQVGESYFKIEYVAGALLIMLGVALNFKKHK